MIFVAPNRPAGQSYRQWPDDGPRNFLHTLRAIEGAVRSFLSSFVVPHWAEQGCFIAGAVVQGNVEKLEKCHPVTDRVNRFNSGVYAIYAG